MSVTRMPSEPLSPEEERRVRATWADFLAAVDPDHHPIGVVPRLLATLDRDRDTLDSLTAERRDIAEKLEARTAAFRGLVDDLLDLAAGLGPTGSQRAVIAELRQRARAALSEGGSK